MTEPRWGPTRALGRAVLLTGLLIMVAVVLGRLDFVVLAAPFAIGTAWSLRRRPSQAPCVAVESASATMEGDLLAGSMTVTNPNEVKLDAVVVRVKHSVWLRRWHRDRPVATDLGAVDQEITLSFVAGRWGRHELGPATVYGVACDALLVSAVATAPSVVVRVHPRLAVFRAHDTMPRTSALVGIHRSRRPGEGGELDGVRRHAPGDRLRRIDWRTTLRSRELHVSQTLSDRDAEVVVVLDVLYEAGASGGIDGAASVVDTSVRAGAAITEHYLRLGDRVSLIEYSGHPRHLPAAGGNRQLHVALEWLLSTRAAAGSHDPPVRGINPHLVPSTALVVVLSPLLGPPSINMIATLARAGRAVIAVDTLGQVGAQPIAGTAWTPVAQRLWRLEREVVIGALRDVGVPVVAWSGPGSIDRVLDDLVRMAAAPRIGRR